MQTLKIGYAPFMMVVQCPLKRQTKFANQTFYSYNPHEAVLKQIFEKTAPVCCLLNKVALWKEQTFYNHGTSTRQQSPAPRSAAESSVKTRARICKPFRSPGIDSQPGGLVRHPYLTSGSLNIVLVQFNNHWAKQICKISYWHQSTIDAVQMFSFLRRIIEN